MSNKINYIDSIVPPLFVVKGCEYAIDLFMIDNHEFELESSEYDQGHYGYTVLRLKPLVDADLATSKLGDFLAKYERLIEPLKVDEANK
jgi:hypothetical protein